MSQNVLKPHTSRLLHSTGDGNGVACAIGLSRELNDHANSDKVDAGQDGSWMTFTDPLVAGVTSTVTGTVDFVGNILPKDEQKAINENVAGQISELWKQMKEKEESLLATIKEQADRHARREEQLKAEIMKDYDDKILVLKQSVFDELAQDEDETFVSATVVAVCITAEKGRSSEC